MGVGGKGTLQAAGVRDPWGLGGSGEGRGGIWLCSDPPLCPHALRALGGEATPSGGQWGDCRAGPARGSPGDLGLSEDSPRSSQCPGSHPPSIPM